MSAQADPEAASNTAGKVFAVPELLETILLEVDERTLLLSQRVNKTFRDTIIGSVKLQRKLWFLPTPTKAEAEDKNKTIEVNPLLFRPSTSSEKAVICRFGYYLSDIDKRPSFQFCVMTGHDDGSLDTPAGSWRKMLIARGGAEFWAAGEFMSKTGPYEHDALFAVFYKVCGEGVTADMLADQVQAEVDKAKWLSAYLMKLRRGKEGETDEGLV